MSLLALLACTESPVAQAPIAKEPPCSTEDLPATYTLSAPIEIRVDDLHVAHVYAQNDADLFFGAGYQQATDRMYDIQQARRATLGRRAEVEGEGAVDSDIVARVFDFEGLACPTARNVATARPDDWTLVVAFAAGINARVDEVDAGLAELPLGFGPDEFDYKPERLSPVEILAMGKRIELGYSNQLDYDILNTVAQQMVGSYDEFPVYESGADRFIVGGASEERTDGPPAPDRSIVDVEVDLGKLSTLVDTHSVGRASNNWAVSGAYTADGRPFVANDPHAGLTLPGRVYLYHLNSADAGGAFDVAGFAFPGVPGVQLGHTSTTAWAATVNFGDAMDLYDVAIADGYADIGGEAVAVVETEHTLEVLQADGSLAAERFTVTGIPGYGVVLPERLLPVPVGLLARGDVMIAWTGFDTDAATEVFQYLDFGRARTLDDWAAAVDYEIVGMQNWVGATAEEIRYKTHGRIPVRSGVPNRVQDASDPASLWTGEYLDPTLLPALDGDRPFIVTANNDPFGNTADNDPLNDAIYHGSFYDPGFRADRIASELERLTTRGSVTFEEMVALQFDVHSGVAARMLPLLAEAVAAIATDEQLVDYRDREDVAAAAARLDGWNGSMDAGSAEALLYRVWAAFLSQRTLSSDMSTMFEAIESRSPVMIANIALLAHEQGISTLLDGRERYDLVAALSDATLWLAAHPELGSWGDLHAARFSGDWREDVVLSTGGDDETVNVGSCSMWDAGDLRTDCRADGGAIFRQVTRFGDDGVPEMWFHLGYGEAGEPGDWLDGTMRHLPFRKTEVEERTVETKTLEP